jgi:hypothetical protein
MDYSGLAGRPALIYGSEGQRSTPVHSPSRVLSLSSSLIRQRSGVSAEHRTRPRGRGHRRCWPALNARPQTWKACWGQPLRSSNLLSSAMLTRQNVIGSVRSARPIRLLVSVGILLVDPTPRYATPLGAGLPVNQVPPALGVRETDGHGLRALRLRRQPSPMKM